MPDDIEVVFNAQKLSLFPLKLKDLKTNCSCPDWSNPCKHIAAVYYLLGEEFDRDPFLIFKLRGMDRDELVRSLGVASDVRPKKRRGKGGGGDEGMESIPVMASEPLPEDPELFWRSPGKEKQVEKEVLIPKLPAALANRLGSFPLWRSDEPFLESLERIYAAASSVGLDVYIGESGDSKVP